MSDAPSEPRSGWFWPNLIALIVLVPLGTIFFRRHLESYVTGIVLIGGVFTIWAFVRLVWGLVEKTLKLDTWDFSRRQLSSPGATRLLIVAALALAFLWWTTASLYFESSGASSGKYQVQVVRADTGRDYLEPLSIGSSAEVYGVPRFLQFEPIALKCHIVDPIGYEPIACPIEPGKSRRVRVPGGFKEKEYHLVRLVPTGALLRRLPRATQDEPSNYTIEITVRPADASAANTTLRWADLRKQTLYLVPVDEAERALVQRLEDPEAYRRELINTFLSRDLPEDIAEQTAAILVESRQSWPVAYLRKGDALTIDVKRQPSADDPDAVDGGSVTVKHEVTHSKVQTVWLPVIE